jgi:hypothetical protein
MRLLIFAFFALLNWSRLKRSLCAVLLPIRAGP